MPADRIQHITEANATFLAFIDIWDRYRHDADVADFAFGNPQELAIDGYGAALAAVTDPSDKHHYEYKRSEDEPRRTVARHLREWRGQPFEPEDIALTPGAFGAIAVAMTTLVDIGDEVIFSLPPWFFYESMVVSVGGVPVKIPVLDDDYDLDIEAIASAITERTRLVIVNTPNNPTGRIYPPETLERLAEILTEASDRYGSPIYLLSDEPYARLVFSDASFTSPAQYYPNTLIAYSYGKILLTPGYGTLPRTPPSRHADALHPIRSRAAATPLARPRRPGPGARLLGGGRCAARRSLRGGLRRLARPTDRRGPLRPDPRRHQPRKPVSARGRHRRPGLRRLLQGSAGHGHRERALLLAVGPALRTRARA